MNYPKITHVLNLNIIDVDIFRMIKGVSPRSGPVSSVLSARCAVRVVSLSKGPFLAAVVVL